ncbi:MAG: nucleotide exchange factor GrpE [Pyrinomonadaceae bacterium]|nr:nucleotide exchange factor GrpE [Pyrinomonadaceae bacterium]
MISPLVNPETESETGAHAQIDNQPETAALEDLSQEIRRVGRELFKATRSTERNQELFQTALQEVRRMNTLVAELPAQSAEVARSVKASICRELLSVVDALDASLAAAQGTLARLQETSDHSAKGIVFKFSTARALRDSLTEAVAAMRQWNEGQQLVRERLMQALQSLGLRAVETIGRPFDPGFHRAVSVESREGVPSGTIVGEDLKGYMLDGKILRYAEVIVARDE